MGDSGTNTIRPDDLPQRRETTRRDLLAAAGTLAAAAVSAAVPANAAAGITEGFFLVYEPRGGADPDADTRIFFISSEWLQYFEVTDVYRLMNMDPAEVVKNIRQSGSSKVRRMKILYGDNADIPGPVGGTTLIPPRPPVGSETYLAMMISAGAVPA